MAHLVAWQEIALAVATELAVNEASPTKARADADWERRGGEVINAELDATWAARPMAELRERFRTVPGELRGYLTVVPETRWLKHAGQPAVLLGRDDRPLPGPPRRSRCDPGGRWPVTLGELLADSAIDLAGCSVETGARRRPNVVAEQAAVRRVVGRWPDRRVPARPGRRRCGGPDARREPIRAAVRLGRVHAGRARRSRRRPGGRLVRLGLSTDRAARLGSIR